MTLHVAAITCLVLGALACTPERGAPAAAAPRAPAARSATRPYDGPADSRLPPQPFDLAALRPQLHEAATTARRACASLPASTETCIDYSRYRGPAIYVTLRIDPEGHVDVLRVAPAAGAWEQPGPRSRCVRDAFRGVRVPPWSGDDYAWLDWYLLVPPP